MKDYKKLKIAIDGPSGAGKSTIAKEIASRTGLVYVDTGALYRSIGLYVMEHSIAPDDTESIINCLGEINIELKYENGEQKVYLCGTEVGNRIRTPDASKYASSVSKIPAVRDFLLGLQKNIAAKGGVIMDGRDIGTVIMPDADLKIFMTASPQARAQRRCDELNEKGMPQPYDEVLKDIIERDKADRERQTAPCVPASDAVEFENDKYTVESSAEYIISLIESI